MSLGGFGRAYDLCVFNDVMYLPMFKENYILALDTENFNEIRRWTVPICHGVNVVNGKVVTSNYSHKSISILEGDNWVNVPIPNMKEASSCSSSCGYKGRILVADYGGNRLIFSDGEVLMDIHQPHSIWSEGDTLYVSSRGTGVVIIENGKVTKTLPYGDPVNARVFSGVLYVADYGTHTLKKEDGTLLRGGDIVSMWEHKGIMYCTHEFSQSNPQKV